mmetsp:Transcript_121067/g.353796  ORF Transcript_121067/g.353796 Transcript_121067/m.353796 type:complete len:261 (+) Transcript_121067:125-907(+)
MDRARQPDHSGRVLYEGMPQSSAQFQLQGVACACVGHSLLRLREPHHLRRPGSRERHHVLAALVDGRGQARHPHSLPRGQAQHGGQGRPHRGLQGLCEGLHPAEDHLALRVLRRERLGVLAHGAEAEHGVRRVLGWVLAAVHVNMQQAAPSAACGPRSHLAEPGVLRQLLRKQVVWISVGGVKRLGHSIDGTHGLARPAEHAAAQLPGNSPCEHAGVLLERVQRLPVPPQEGVVRRRGQERLRPEALELAAPRGLPRLVL